MKGKNERNAKIAVVVLSVMVIGLIALKNDKIVTKISNSNPIKFLFSNDTKKVPTKEELLASINNFKEKGSVCDENNKVYKCQKATILHEAGGVSYGRLSSGSSLTPGDAYDCDVNGDSVYDPDIERFYYITDLDTDNSYAVLLYYTNVQGGIPNRNYTVDWGTISGGPTSARTHLPTTSMWKNVSLSSSIRNIKKFDGTTLIEGFSYEGYAARLLTQSEVKEACPTSQFRVSNSLSDCSWLLENMPSVSWPGYWLEDFDGINYSNTALVLYGPTNAIDTTYANQSVHSTRPVIEVKKSDLEL